MGLSRSHCRREVLILEDKQIAKEILIALIQNNGLRMDYYPDAQTPAIAVGKAYQEILKAVKED